MADLSARRVILPETPRAPHKRTDWVYIVLRRDMSESPQAVFAGRDTALAYLDGLEQPDLWYLDQMELRRGKRHPPRYDNRRRSK